MSLIAHYPLNGDTLDYSGNGNNGTNYGAVIDDSGKIGKCYSFDGVDKYVQIVHNGELSNANKVVSISCWYKMNTSTGTYQQIIANSLANSTARQWGLVINSANRINWFATVNSVWGNRLLSNMTLELNKWYNILLIHDYNKIKLYVNGVLDAEASVSGQLSSNPVHITIGKRYGGEYVNGKINDVRIYDHVLSEKEVKEISKAKILHYTFDEFAEPTENIFSFDVHERCWNGGSSNVCSLREIEDAHSVSVKGQASVASSAGYAYIYPHFNTTNDIHTVSFVVRNNNSAQSRITVRIRDGSNGNNLSTLESYDINAGETRKIIHTSHSPVTQNQVTVGLSAHTDSSGYVDCDIFDIQLEAKPYSTPFTPNIRSGIVKDKSGYENDATLQVATAPKWTENSRIGKGAYYFGENKRIETQINTPEQITMNCWFKSNVVGSNTYHIPISIDGGNFEMSVDSSGQLGIGFYINGSRKIGRTFGYCMDGNWHMLTGTYDGKTIKGYVDGVLGGTLSYTGSLSRITGTLRVGKYTSAETYGNKDAYEDDVRIYATALSEEDVKELYQTRMNIDDKGNLFVNGVDIPDSTNLVVNGNQEMESNRNFSQFEYDSVNRCLSRNSNPATLSSDIYIPVNKEDSYKLSGEFKDPINVPSRYYYGFHCFDKDFNEIMHNMVSFYTATKTTLAQPLNNGDTTVVLTSSASWRSDDPGNYQHYKCIGFWGNQSKYPDYTYTRALAHYLSVSGNTLTLRYPWSGGTVPAGTPVANMYSGSTYMYSGAVNPFTTLDWMYRESGLISGWGQTSNVVWRYGTEYVKIMFLLNRNAASTPTTLVRNIHLENVSNHQTVEFDKVTVSLNDKGNLQTKNISDKSLPVRYIRDYINGSTANTGNHWVEIQAINKVGSNIAFSSNATSPLLTDGSTATSPHYSTGLAGDGGRYVEVDLGNIVDISQIKVWHYWSDGRTYHNTKTEVSADGINWQTVFDSAIEGEYPETSAGHTINLKPTLFSISEDGTVYTPNIYDSY